MPRPSEILTNKFPFVATQGQQELFNITDDFLKDTGQHKVLLIKGYAGTGKTTIVSTLVTTLPLFNKKCILLASTGRAAKVMSLYAKKIAFTVHKRIYKQVGNVGDGIAFKKQKNYAKDTVFIVDEASMIHEDHAFGATGLLTDLIAYVFSDSSNKLILIGDDAQLPPVGQLISPALDRDHLERYFDISLYEVVLTEVMRQELGSGILINATKLRNELLPTTPAITFHTKGYKDIFRITGERLEDGLRYGYDNYGIENTVVICRSNKQANNYNQYIRRAIHFYDNELEAGELLMVTRNNYHFTPDDVTGNFLANGDFIEVFKIMSEEEQYGLRFATLSLRLTDYPDAEPFEAKVILDTLYTEGPSLSQAQNKLLYQAIWDSYTDLPPRKRKEAVKSDPYLNALQVKFAYALTCHKAQGGQWEIVFVEQGYLKNGTIDTEYVRWLYTAVTRATRQLFLVNFDDKMFV